MARTRVFDIDHAIEIATDLFWKQGYDRTSLSDLTEAVGITPPSFYHAFGSKEGLFQKVIDRYTARHVGFIGEALAQPTALAATEHLLHGYADALTNPDRPQGCLALNCALPYAKDDEGIRKALFDNRCRFRDELLIRFKRARTEGDLPAGIDLPGLVRFVQIVGYGMAVEAQSGATRPDLHRAVDIALGAWPGKTAAKPAATAKPRQLSHTATRANRKAAKPN
jgi:AcrR family transcriptional regulator